MKLLNRKNLPEIICRAVANDPYEAGDTDYSATTLIKPAYQVMLQKKHADEITEDVADRLWAMYGTAVHYIIERGADMNDLVEERFFAKIGGWKISAQIDHYVNRVISDWKLTGAYKIQKAMVDGDFEDWEQQLNIQAWLANHNGLPVDKLQIGAMCRDWSKRDWMTKTGYPDQIEYIEIPLWSNEKQEDFILERIEAMENPQPCTQAERWQRDPTYALMKKGGSRALKVESSLNDIQNHAQGKSLGCFEKEDGGHFKFVMTSDDHYIDTRTAPNNRCEFYCNVNTHCDYYNANYAKADDLPLK